MSNLQERLLASAIGIPLVLTAIYFSDDPALKFLFATLLASISTCALQEFFAITSAKGAKPLKGMTMVFSGLLLFSLVFLPRHPLVSELVLLLYFLSAFLHFFKADEEPVRNLSATFFGFLYVSIPLVFLALIPGMEMGRIWLFYLLVIVKSTDTAAFFFGKALGKTRLAPYISPKKTWEGAIFGFFTAVLLSALFSLTGHLFGFNLSLFSSVLLGALISLGAQIGDLSESLLKRDAQIKDSSSLPGLGGILDIVDSLVFTSPLLYIWIKYGLFNGVPT